MSKDTITAEDRALIALGQLEATLSGLRQAKRLLIAWRQGELADDPSTVVLAAARRVAESASATVTAARDLENAIQPSLGLEPEED